MVEIAIREDLEDWLGGRDHLDARLLALRAVERALPFVSCDEWQDDIRPDVFEDEDGEPRDLDRFRSRILLLGFRAALIQSVAIFGRSEEIDEAIDHVDEGFMETAEETVGYSDEALTTMAYAIWSWYTHSEAAWCNAAQAVEHEEINHDHGSWKHVQYDVDLLKDGRDKMLASPLWPDGPPDLAVKAWMKTKTLLSKPEALEEDWSFWIEWYEGRQNGVPFAPNPLDKAIALIPQEIWGAGPKAVNVEIARLKAELK